MYMHEGKTPLCKMITKTLSTVWEITEQKAMRHSIQEKVSSIKRTK